MISVGLFGIGLDTYWPQFDGLRERLLGYQHQIAAQLREVGCEVVDVGLVDDPQAARDAAEQLRTASVELVILYVSTYALSHTVLPVVQRAGAPVVVLTLQPTARIDYAAINALGDRGRMTGEWLAYCQACVAPEIASVLRRTGHPLRQVTGYLGEHHVTVQISEYIHAARLVAGLRNARIGLLGHYYNGMLDVYSDLTRLAGVLGCHFELREFGELVALRQNLSSEALDAKRSEFRERFDVSPDCEDSELERAASTAVALDALVRNNALDALAYYFEAADDAPAQDVVTSLIPGLTLLTGNGVPCAGEYEVKNALAMKALDLLDAGGSFSELYAIDFADDVVLWGHDGPAHFRMADGQVGLVPVPVYHGKPGKGLSIQMAVASGPVTLLSVCEGGSGDVFFCVAEGEAVEGETLQIGNTNSRYRFSLSAREFVEQWSAAGPNHHCAIGRGHLGGVLAKATDLLGIDCKRIC